MERLTLNKGGITSTLILKERRLRVSAGGGEEAMRLTLKMSSVFSRIRRQNHLLKIGNCKELYRGSG